MARRKAQAGAARAASAPAAVVTRVALKADSDTPVYYVNFAEVSFTAHEFSLSAVRVPAKLAPDVLERGREDGSLTLQADIQVLIPPTMVPGLIKALSITKDQYEQSTGVTIKDVGAEK